MKIKSFLGIILCLFLVSCATPGPENVAVFNDQEVSNQEIFGKTDNKPVNETVTDEDDTDKIFKTLNIFKSTPEKLRELFKNPRGMAVDKDGNFYILDQQQNFLVKFNPQGQFVDKWGHFGKDPESFNEPKYIIATPDNKLILSDTWNARVKLMDTNGTVKEVFEGDFYGPKGVGFYGNSVYFSDTGNHKIRIISLDRTKNAIIPTEGEGYDKINEPTGLVLDDKGNLYVLDSKNNRFLKFDKNHKYLKQWHIEGWNDVDTGKEAWLVYYKGRIYMTDIVNNSVRVYDTEGKELPKLIDKVDAPFGLAIYKDKAYILDNFNMKIVVKKLK